MTNQTAREQQRRLLEDIANRAHSTHHRVDTAAREFRTGGHSELSVYHVAHIEAEFEKALHHLNGVRFTLEALLAKSAEPAEEVEQHEQRHVDLPGS